MTKPCQIKAGPAEIEAGVFTPNGISLPRVFSVPLVEARGGELSSDGFTVRYLPEEARGIVPFTAEFMPVEYFLNPDSTERAIEYSELVRAICLEYEQPTLAQAFHLCLAHGRELPPSDLVLFPIKDGLSVPGFGEQMFLTRGVDSGRKLWSSNGCFRPRDFPMSLASEKCVFTGYPFVVVIVR